jgi:hypothetical protein
VDEFNPIRALGDLPPGHAGRVRYLANCDRSVMGSIPLGVLFVMAWWSGPSRQAFAKLKQVLAEVDPNGRLELVVVDADGCADLAVCPEFAGTLHGNGETAWIREGRVIRTSGIGFHSECFEPNTRELLNSVDTTHASRAR